MTNSQTKRDITRLKNLLRDYRDHIITRFSAARPDLDTTICIRGVDEAISLIKNNL